MITARKASVRVRVRVRVRARAMARCARARADQRRGGEGERRGVARPGGAPERPRRAQRARHALPKAGGVPCCAPLRRASSTSPPAMGADRDASAGRCGAVRGGRVGPSRVVAALRQGRARAVQAAHVPRAAAPPMALGHEPAEEDERPARRPASVERLPHRDGAAASPTAARTARRRPEPERPRRDGALLVSLRGVINRGCKAEWGPRQKPMPERPRYLLGPSPSWANASPSPTGDARLARSRRSAWRWLYTTPSRRAVGTAHDRPQIGTKPARASPESIPRLRLARRGAQARGGSPATGSCSRRSGGGLQNAEIAFLGG